MNEEHWTRNKRMITDDGRLDNTMKLEESEFICKKEWQKTNYGN